MYLYASQVLRIRFIMSLVIRMEIEHINSEEFDDNLCHEVMKIVINIFFSDNNLDKIYFERVRIGISFHDG